MHNNQFCQLHNHSYFSTLDGLPSPETYAKRASEMGYQHLGLSDHGSVSGLIEHQKACEKYNIHPVLGCEGYLTQHMHIKQKGVKNSHINFFVKNAKGWGTLMRLMTISNNIGFYYRARLDFDLLLNTDLDGLIITTACAGSFINLEGGIDFFWKLHNKIGDNLYIEIMPHRIDMQKDIHSAITKLVEKDLSLEKQIIGTNDSHYALKDDDIAQEVLLAVNRRAKWDDPKRFSFGFNGLHLRSASEMQIEFRKQNHFDMDVINNSLTNTINLAERCEFIIPKKEICLPAVQYKEEISEDDKVYGIALEGYKRIFGGELVDGEYKERLDFEFALLKSKGFLRYFLLVWDLLEYCKKDGIPVGPGRGSVSGSLLAYLMGITKVDPMEHGLFFERFIAIGRADYPDIDLDFGDVKRHKVKEYLEKTYGSNRICSIPTFITIKDRGAIRDVCRVFDVPEKEVDEFAKSIWRDDTIKSACIKTPVGREFYKSHRKEVDLAMKLDGTIKSMGRHAAALVVSGEDLTQTDKTCLKTVSGMATSCWSMSDAEYCGLMKLDVLSLNTLTVIDECERLIGGGFSVDDIPMGDKDVFGMLDSCKLAGVFQMSSHTFIDYVSGMGVSSFNDIVASLALVRPGPMDSGMSDDYVNRKHGHDWVKSHPIYEEITKDTFGICVYQEQMLQVISRLAGLPFATADKIRKVIGKKRDAKEFEPFKILFIEGCAKEKTFTKSEAESFWGGLLKWSEYGFSKAHSVAYGMIAYWTAWLKYHHTTEFVCAHLTYANEKDGIVKESKGLGYKFIPPKIGISGPIKWVADGDKIFAPFVAIMGVGEKVADAIGKPVKSHNFGFFKRGTPRAKGKTEALLRDIGAYDKNDVPWQINDYMEMKIF